MNTNEHFFHRFFKFIWNAIFVLTYPVLATFGLLFIGVTYFFSFISRLLARLSTSSPEIENKSEWKRLSAETDLIEGKLYKQIIFGPECYQLRRKDGIPSVMDDFIFGKKVIALEEGLLLEKWNTTELAQIPDFDICLYQPDEDKLVKLAHIKCFDWHLSERQDDFVYLKWFDGTQGGEVKVALA
ncbi:hypothetical protein [Cyclobacterium jeungdonense]|uniref:Uncharacterized protein n=1 Tax=Cyclobacterium jeungdonense TaxID=708087 RepID=A0ABT8C3W6_9BACT|nr:hypothetical protein [Cyclobacterium jeungdonense]MDN3686782.1 hypothetical protein [Cyclobacterium jeungdonense]